MYQNKQFVCFKLNLVEQRGVEPLSKIPYDKISTSLARFQSHYITGYSVPII